MRYSKRIDHAIAVSATAHADQVRKGTIVPYITHPFAVALIASECTDDEDVTIGALFHDILEDVSSDVYSREQMAREFGERVVKLVVAVSEDKTPGQPEKPWKQRKEEYIEHLRQTADEGVLIISAADKLHNLSSILSDYETIGDQLWQRFNAPAAEQLWYYATLSEILIEKLGTQHVLAHKLAENVAMLQQIVNKPTSVN